MRVLSFALLCLIACGQNKGLAPDQESYSGQWLQLDQYFEDSCFVLDEETKTVWVFDDGEEVQTHKDEWPWVYDGYDKYVFDGAVDLYVEPIVNQCWKMSIWGIAVNACPCALAIPPQPEEG